MKSQRISKLSGQVRALQGIGYARREAIRFVASGEANRIRKALPEIDKPLPTPPNRESGKWTAKTDRINEQQKNRPNLNTTKPAEKPDKRPTGKHGRPLSFTRYNIKHKDGSVWSYEIKPSGQLVVRPPSQFDVPTYTVEQWRAMHEGINNHISERDTAGKNAEKGEQSKQPVKTGNKGDLKKMEKAQRFEKLVAVARKNPERISSTTLLTLNKHLVGKGMEPISKALPFGQSVLAATMTANKFNQLSGHQQSALKAGLDPATPGIESMSFPQMQAVAEQQQLEQVNKQRGLYGMPPLEPDQTKQQSVCYLDFK